MKFTRRTVTGSLLATAAGALPRLSGRLFQNKPVKIPVGFAAGGGAPTSWRASSAKR